MTGVLGFVLWAFVYLDLPNQPASDDAMIISGVILIAAQSLISSRKK